MLDMWSRFFFISLMVVAPILIVALIAVPPAILCFYMGWSLYVFEHLTGLWILIMISWVLVYLFVTGKIQ